MGKKLTALLLSAFMAASAAFCASAAELTGQQPQSYAQSVKSTGPLYWMGYEQCYTEDAPLSEERWDKNVDWVEQNFLKYGYSMMSTDGWVEGAQAVNEHGYVTKYNYNWKKTWKDMSDQLSKKGMTLGVYYNPLWITAQAADPKNNCTIEGTSSLPVSGLLNSEYAFFSRYNGKVELPGSIPHSSEDTALYWLDTDKPGAEQYVKNYVKFFAENGVKFLRVDFLGWYESGENGDPDNYNGSKAYGTQRYKKALAWMNEACGKYGVMLSLVMPNLYNHAENEVPNGDMMRINEDVFGGGWDHISDRKRGQHQEYWSQWANSFDGFTAWSDVSGRGQMILDGDFVRLNRYVENKDTAKEDIDAQKRSTISLLAMAGSPIAIADQYDTIDNRNDTGISNYTYYQNEEVLALNQAGFVGKPIERGESERWAGQLPDGSFVVGLFNRTGSAKTQKIDFTAELGVKDAQVRDLWDHRDLGALNSFQTELAPYGCALLKITPGETAGIRLEAESASLFGAEVNNNVSGFSGFGFAQGMQKGDKALFCAARDGAGEYALSLCYKAQADTLIDVSVNGKTVGRSVKLPQAKDWTAGFDIGAYFLSGGDNIIEITVTDGFLTLDYIDVGKNSRETFQKTLYTQEAEDAALHKTAQEDDSFALTYGGACVSLPDKDASVDFMVDAEFSGTYELRLRYANGYKKKAAQAHFAVNGGEDTALSLAPMGVMAWNNWDGATARVTLNKGKNTITVKNSGGTKFNIDRLSLRLIEEKDAPQEQSGQAARQPGSAGEEIGSQATAVIIIAAVFIAGLLCLFIVLKKRNKRKSEKSVPKK